MEQTLTLTKTSARKLQRTQRKKERSMLDVRLRNKVRNEEIRKRTRVENVIEHGWTKKILE